MVSWYPYVLSFRLSVNIKMYNRLEAEQELIKRFGFESTGEKHEESIFTRWFQAWYLFEKFGIDKRKAHYSSLINSGQMTRKEAKELLAQEPIYPKLGIEKKVMEYPRKPYTYFKTDEFWRNIFTKVIHFLKHGDFK